MYVLREDVTDWVLRWQWWWVEGSVEIYVAGFAREEWAIGYGERGGLL